MTREVTLVVPGSVDTLTGGFIYDRRIAAELRARGWRVEVRELHASFPHPTAAALDHAEAVFASMPAGSLALIDGLAGGAMPAIVERHAGRLRLVALVHHPLAQEAGLGPADRSRLEASERRTLAAARLVVVTSRQTAETLADYGVASHRIVIVEPGTDRAPLAAGSSGSPLRLLTVASVIPRKGHVTLVRALASLARADWRLICVGSLDRHPQTAALLRSTIEAAGLERQVTLAGEVDPHTVSAYYHGADLFVLATEYEGYGMAAAEALARGLPVVSTPAGAIADLVGDGAGLLVPPGDVAALAAALGRVLEGPDLRARLAAGARRVRRRLPAWPAAAARMAAALSSIPPA